MPTIEQRRKKTPVKSVADKHEYRHLFEKRGARVIPVKVPQAFRPPSTSSAKHTELPGTYLKLEQLPISAFNDNPVLNERGAAELLRLSVELLKKWRQRKMGPDYIQYGPGGPVRYTIKALLEFQEAHTVKPRRKKK